MDMSRYHCKAVSTYSPSWEEGGRIGEENVSMKSRKPRSSEEQDCAGLLIG
jgi:hypothetical protein